MEGKFNFSANLQRIVKAGFPLHLEVAIMNESKFRLSLEVQLIATTTFTVRQHSYSRSETLFETVIENGSVESRCVLGFCSHF